ncbi:MAG: cytochrome c [Planctomycetes bacterium]|nr:cytochrome c [Planctomycetota bacterium]
MAAVGLLAGGCDDDGRNRVTKEGVATSGLAISAPEEPLDNDKRRRLLREKLRAALGEHYDAPFPEATEDDLKKGAELWSLLCLGCHGHNGTGRRTLSRMLPIQPGNLTDPERAAYFSGQAKLWIVAEGSPGTPMFGWKEVLTEEDIQAVVAHLGTLMPAKQDR